MSSSCSSSLLSMPTLSLSNARSPIPLRRPSSKARGERNQHPALDDIDRISTLPDELLLKIISTLSLKDAVKTGVLSQRWVDLWKQKLDLCVDMGFIMRTNPTDRVNEVSRSFAESMTQTMKNHRGRLESCTIRHFSRQCEDGTLERWIRTVTHVKHTKELTLVNFIGCLGPTGGYTTLPSDPSTFSHHSLTSLSLTRYKLTETNAFKSCCNLKTLKIHDILVDVNVFNEVLKACSSLEVLVLQTSTLKGHGELEIKNKNLKVLQVVCITQIIKVNAPSLEILDILFRFFGSHNFFLDAPKIRFNRNFWGYHHISFNISSLTQEKKNILLEIMVSQSYHWRRIGSLSVSIDVKNPKEVEILKEVLLLWGEEMLELEIIFMNNDAPIEEGESSAHKKWWNGDNPYPNEHFRVNTVWMYNFNGSDEEEFALASCFVTQKTVIDKLMIETSTYPPMKQLMVKTQVAKLMELSDEDNDHFTIECF